MTIRERAAAIKQAQAHFDQLTADPNLSRNRLGTARDHLNRVRNLAAAEDVWAAVNALDALTTK